MTRARARIYCLPACPSVRPSVRPSVSPSIRVRCLVELASISFPVHFAVSQCRFTTQWRQVPRDNIDHLQQHQVQSASQLRCPRPGELRFYLVSQSASPHNVDSHSVDRCFGLTSLTLSHSAHAKRDRTDARRRCSRGRRWRRCPAWA